MSYNLKKVVFRIAVLNWLTLTLAHALCSPSLRFLSLFPVYKLSCINVMHSLTCESLRSGSLAASGEPSVRASPAPDTSPALALMALRLSDCSSLSFLSFSALPLRMYLVFDSMFSGRDLRTCAFLNVCLARTFLRDCLANAL